MHVPISCRTDATYYNCQIGIVCIDYDTVSGNLTCYDQVDVARGYSHPHLHNMSAKTSADAASSEAQQPGLTLLECTRTAQRLRGDSIIGNTTKIAAVRIGANGWEADIIAGLGVSAVLCELYQCQCKSSCDNECHETCLAC